jgi:hypothetical protein
MVRTQYGMDVDFSTSVLPRDDWHDGLYVAARFQAVVWNDGWTSQALTDTFGVIVETWEGLWGISADRSLSD